MNAIHNTPERGVQVPATVVRKREGRTGSKRDPIHDDFATREETILKAALAEFCSAGYEATSINSIAASVGVSAGLLYKHFDSKEHLLYQAIAFQYRKDVAGFIARIGEVDGALPKLRKFIGMHLSSWRDTPNFNLLFFHETRRPVHQYSAIVQEHSRTYVHCLETILEDGIKSGEFASHINVRFIRDFLIGGLDHSVWWPAATGRPIDVEGLTEQAMAHFVPSLLASRDGAGA